MALFGSKKNDKNSETAETDISQINAELVISAKYLEKHFYKKADRAVKYYELNHYYDPQTGKSTIAEYDRIKVPYPYANSRQILAEIFVQTPEPIIHPTKPTIAVTDPTTGQPTTIDMCKGAEKLESVLKYIVKESRLKPESKLVILDSIVTGLGILMFSAQKDSKVPKYTREIYRNILWSAEVLQPYYSPWVARRLVRAIKDVKHDESYNSSVRSRVKATAKLDPAWISSEEKVDTSKFAVLWDYWNKKDDRHLVYADGMTGKDDALIDEKITAKYQFKVENDEFSTDWPFIFLVNEEMLSESFGLGDILPIESQVRELDKIRTLQINHIKRFNRKYGYFEGTLDEQGINQLKNPDDGTLVKFKKEITPNNFQTIQDAPISADVYRMDGAIQQDIQLISPTGANSLRQGVGTQPGTLGQAEIINQNVDTRLSEKRDNVAEFFKRVFRLSAQYVQQYWVEEDVFLVTGDGSKDTDWLKYSPMEIQGEYSYDVDPETLKDNSAVYRKQAADALATVAPLLLQLYPQGLRVMIRKYLETFKWKDLDAILPEQAPNQPMPGQGAPGPQDPMQAQLMQLIQSNDPKQIIAATQGLPPDQRQAILSHIQQFMGQSGSSGPPMAPGAPQPGLSPASPSNSALIGNANRVA